MNSIHDNKVNNKAECNLLHDIINPPKCTKILNIYYSPILHGCMNTIGVEWSLRNFEYYLIVDVVPGL